MKEVEQTLYFFILVIYFNETLNLIYLMKAADYCYSFNTTEGKLMSNKVLIV